MRWDEGSSSSSSSRGSGEVCARPVSNTRKRRTFHCGDFNFPRKRQISIPSLVKRGLFLEIIIKKFNIHNVFFNPREFVHNSEFHEPNLKIYSREWMSLILRGYSLLTPRLVPRSITSFWWYDLELDYPCALRSCGLSRQDWNFVAFWVRLC